MHDVVRDVALLIASEGDGNNMFLVEAGKGLTEWLPRKNELESYTGISLMNNKIRKLPNYELHLPHLDIFLIQRNDELPMFSDELIRGMKEVRVLDMSYCNGQPLPQSFKLLTKLRMLNLSGNKSLHDISILAEMQDLEILNLNKTGIKEIPEEIGQLVNLRHLRAINCENLYHIAPGVISKLWRLEELLIGFEIPFLVVDGIYECIVEIMNLSNLIYFALRVPSFDVIPEGFNPRKLKGFVIQIGGYFKYSYSAANSKLRRLLINTTYAEIPSSNKQLFEASHVPQLYHEGFNELQHIKLNKCDNVSCLVDTANWEGKIKDKCDKLVKVIWDGDEETSKSETEHSEYIVFRSLAKIKLRSLQRLTSFYSGHSTIKYPSLVEVYIIDCKSMTMWGPGIHETPKLKFVNNVQLDGPDATINYAVNKIYEALLLEDMKIQMKIE